MARKYIRRRYYRRKGRWSANIKTLTEQAINTASNSSFYGATDLCSNPVQLDTTVSQQYTCKNIELSFEIESSSTNELNIEGLTSYIMFVPQGMIVTETYPNTHPEYILAYRYIGSPTIDGQQPGRLPVKIKTRMARRLQTGDKIILLVVGTNTSTDAPVLRFGGLVRWWTKAN